MSDSMPPAQNPYQTVQPMSPSDEKMWAILIHIGGIVFASLPALPAFIGYLVLKDRGPFVRQHTTAALNFQITLLIAYFVGVVTSILLIGFFIIIAAAVVNIVFSILAAIAANKGVGYEYPLAIKFIK